MLNRYHGNSGRVEHIDDGEGATLAPVMRAPLGAPPPDTAAETAGGVQASGAASAAPRPTAGGVRQMGEGLTKGPGRLLPGALDELRALETEDLLLLAVLYLMYRESGDTELLIIMGAMLLP